MRISLVFFCIWIVCCNSTLAQVRGWRGIVPLHSMRIDVERVLGQPDERISNYSVFYKTPKETVIVHYANGRPCGIGENYSQWRVPRDTVESIFITPTATLPLSKVVIDQSKYEKRSGGHRPEDVYYINDKEGESIRVYQGEVMELSLSPGRMDADLSCSSLPSTSKTGCEGVTPHELDSYGDIPIERERWLLDNFVITLKEHEDAQGYIISYAGKRARVHEAIERAERAKNYSVKVRGFPATRLQVLDGGYREEPAVELFVVPAGVCPPTATPTIDPRDVQIIRGGRSKKNRRASYRASTTTLRN